MERVVTFINGTHVMAKTVMLMAPATVITMIQVSKGFMPPLYVMIAAIIHLLSLYGTLLARYIETIMTYGRELGMDRQ